MTTDTYNANRDPEGRHFTATYWSGDVANLTAEQLDDRIEAIGSHIGRLFTVCDIHTRTWTHEDPPRESLDKAIAFRLAALNELEKRPNRFGDGS